MKIIFILDTTCEREIVFQKKKFGKQQIKNKPYFYLGFPLTKNSFPLTSFFLCYQTLENVKNYLYRRFSDETNRAGVVIEDIHCQAVVFQSSVFNHASRSCNCVADAIAKKARGNWGAQVWLNNPPEDIALCYLMFTKFLFLINNSPVSLSGFSKKKNSWERSLYFRSSSFF